MRRVWNARLRQSCRREFRQSGHRSEFADVVHCTCSLLGSGGLLLQFRVLRDCGTCGVEHPLEPVAHAGSRVKFASRSEKSFLKVGLQVTERVVFVVALPEHLPRVLGIFPTFGRKFRIAYQHVGKILSGQVVRGFYHWVAVRETTGEQYVVQVLLRGRVELGSGRYVALEYVFQCSLRRDSFGEVFREDLHDGRDLFGVVTVKNLTFLFQLVEFAVGVVVEFVTQLLGELGGQFRIEVRVFYPSVPLVQFFLRESVESKSRNRGISSGFGKLREPFREVVRIQHFDTALVVDDLRRNPAVLVPANHAKPVVRFLVRNDSDLSLCTFSSHY